jgi:regulator of protease activity HflC (stomatin/prohibitin superfamily)
LGAVVKNIKESGTIAINGFVLIALLIVGGLFLAANAAAVTQFLGPLDLDNLSPAYYIVAAILFFFIVPSFVINNPNEARVILFFGQYVGTLKNAGFYWVLPFTTREVVSRKVVSLNTKTLKVNDARGNPIEIAAIIVWHVKDSARAALNVDNYREFVAVQSETAIRVMANRYPYDADEGVESLRGSPDKLSAELQAELQHRLDIAGIEVTETRLSHLAYAPEIASAMLRRQQAEAVVSARRIITENAVRMADSAVMQLESEGRLRLDDAAKARLVSNLLVALVSERDTQPIIDLNP